MIEFVDDRRIFEEIFLKAIPEAKDFLWIATADVKDLHVPGGGSQYVSFLSVLAELIRKGIAVRYIHAKEPGPSFRESFDRFPELIDGMERVLCPRNHMKVVIVDGIWAYLGSANMTGAGAGAKSARKRNFEAGIITTESELVTPLMAKFDRLWMGGHCGDCGRRDFCLDPIVPG